MRRDTRNSFSPSFASSVGVDHSPSLRRVCSDVMMLAFWGAMIPAFLWLGNAAGF